MILGVGRHLLWGWSVIASELTESTRVAISPFMALRTRGPKGRGKMIARRQPTSYRVALRATAHALTARLLRRLFRRWRSKRLAMTAPIP